MLYLSHASKAFQNKTVLDDVSLSLQTGDIVAPVGTNGVGKTTLLTILLDAPTPDAVTVSSDNEFMYRKMLRWHQRLPKALICPQKLGGAIMH